MELISNLIKLLSLFVNDRAIKLKKAQKRIEFYNKALIFLKASYSSGSYNYKSTGQQDLTVKEFIHKFNKELIDNFPHFNWLDKRRFKRYIKLAKRHTLLLSKKNILLSRFGLFRIWLCRQQISRKVNWLSKKTGGR